MNEKIKRKEKERKFVGDMEKVYEYSTNTDAIVSIFKEGDKFAITRTWAMNDEIAISIDIKEVDLKTVLEYVHLRGIKNVY